MDVLRTALAHAEAHLDGLAAGPAGAEADYEAILRGVTGPLPDAGCDPGQALDELVAAARPGLVGSPGPRYFGFVTGGSLPAALAADWLVSTWDQNAFSRVSSPAAAAVEACAERWVLEALGLPAYAVVGFATGATTANIAALAAARHRVLERAGWDVESDGLAGAPPIRVLLGEEVHASVLFALRVVGLGTGRAERVPVDENGAIRAADLESALAARQGPLIVCAQAGNVNTGACDPLEAVVEAVHGRGGWAHVDGAFGLWAAASPSRGALVAGMERADSWAVDAHKWLNVPYDCGLAIVADPEASRGALAAQAGYLPEGGARDPYDHVLEMSRRARAIPVWAALRSLGREGVAALVERCCDLATYAASSLAPVPGCAVLNDVVLNQVLVRFDDDDQTTRRVAALVRAGGDAWIGETVWRGRAAVRISVSNWSTTQADVDTLVGAVREALAVVRREA